MLVLSSRRLFWLLFAVVVMVLFGLLLLVEGLVDCIVMVMDAVLALGL